MQRLDAVRAPTPEKNRIPRMRNRRPKPPAAEPVAVANIRPMGCPFATAKSDGMDGRMNRIGIRYSKPVMPAAKTDNTIAFGTSRSGFCTSSHMAATIPYPVKVYAACKRPTNQDHPDAQPEAEASKWVNTNSADR